MNYHIFPALTLTAALLSGCASTPPQGAGAPVESRLPEPQVDSPERARTANAPIQAQREPTARVYPLPATEPVVRPAPVVRPPVAYRVEPSRKPAKTSAVAALLRKAEAAGSPYAAAAILERALRIEPDNPLVWHRLATVRLAQGRPEQAEALALKSNALASRQSSLWPENWDIIARARSRLGNDIGAAEARAKSRSGTR